LTDAGVAEWQTLRT